VSQRGSQERIQWVSAFFENGFVSPSYFKARIKPFYASVTELIDFQIFPDFRGLFTGFL